MTAKYPNLELIEYKFISKLKDIYPEIFVHFYPRVWVEVFEQTWPSTALGFGGCGGSAMTNAYTTVVTVHFSPKSMTEINIINKTPQFRGIYFDGKFAYIVEGEPPKEFFDDLKDRRMADVMVARARYTE